MTIRGVIVMSSLAVGGMNHGPSTVDTSLNVRGSANEMPTKGGAIRNRTSAIKYNTSFSSVHLKVLEARDLPQFSANTTCYTGVS